MRLFTLLIICLFLSFSSRSQDIPKASPATHAIFTELGGPGMHLSLNYDTRIQGRKDGWGIRVGLGSNLNTNPTFFSVPVGLNYLAGHGGNYFEIGGGATYVSLGRTTGDVRYTLGNKDYTGPAHLFFGNMVMGYRRQPTHGGFNFRVGFAPCFGMSMFTMFPYFAVGCNF